MNQRIDLMTRARADECIEKVVLRRLGFRTAREIESERRMLREAQALEAS